MATYISLCEAEAEFEVKFIRLENNDHLNPEYISINPKRKVPFLTVGDKGLSENVAIQSWIAEAFPAANLMPSDPWDQKRALSYMSWFGSGVHPNITRHFKPVKFCSDVNSHDDVRAKAKDMYMEQLALIESELAGRTWFFDHYTVCDSYFFWIYVRGLGEGFDLTKFQYCTDHNNRMRDRPSVNKVLAKSE